MPNKSQNKIKIGILYICTGPYIEFFDDFYNSSEKNFLPNCDKHYFVFTDGDNVLFYNNKKVTVIPQHQLEWPHAVLHKFHYFLQVQHLFQNMDYLICFNANLVFKDKITKDEFLPNKAENYLIGVKHPLYYQQKDNTKFIYDRNQKCKAFIPYGDGKYQYQSAIFGGRKTEFLELCYKLRNNVEKDYANNIIALWHDESQVNWYYYKNPPKTLTPNYLYPENYKLEGMLPKILMFDKNKKGFSYYRKNPINKKEKKPTNIFQKVRKYSIYYIIKFLKKLE